MTQNGTLEINLDYQHQNPLDGDSSYSFNYFCQSVDCFLTDSGAHGSHTNGHTAGPLVLALFIDDYTT